MVNVPSINVHIVDHCNFRCAACNHFAPVVPPAWMDTSELERDLAALQPLLHAPRIYILGGEPMMHKDVLDFLRIARASGIASETWMTTNGSRLAECDDAIYQACDGMIIDRYPGKMTDDEYATINRRAERIGTRITWQDEAHGPSVFYGTVTREDRPDGGLSTWQRCPYKIQCTTVDRGWVYQCPQCTYIPRLLMPDVDKHIDGLEIATTTQQSLIAYLTRGPLVACRRCAHNESWRPWREVRRPDWWEASYAD